MVRAMTRFNLLTVLILGVALAACSKKEDKAGGAASSSKPATKKAPIDEARAKQLAETKVDGFDVQVNPPSEYRKAAATMVFTQQAAPNVEVYVDVSPCDFCQKMDLATWQSDDNLKSMLSESTQNDPGLVWKVDAVDLGGRQAISTYALSYEVSEDGKSRDSMNSYSIWYNDGVNQLHMRTGCGSQVALPESVTDEASLEALCPRDKQLDAAKRVAAVFLANAF
jgi:hypothetical protein